MMCSTGRVVLDVVGLAGGLLGGVSLAYTAVRYKTIEGYKAELQRQGFEHQTRFARLHERRVEVVSELYRQLARTESAVMAFVHPLEMAGEPSKEDLGREAQESSGEFGRYFRENRIWLDEDLIDQVEGLQRRMNEAGIKFGMYLSHGRQGGDDRYFDQWAGAWEIISKDVPPLRHSIEVRFRVMLGIAQASASGS